jgi:colanic acid biosynthesis glycosyl transferase WcaI
VNIKLITRHFWPDSTPGARLHRAILEHLAHQGHDVHVFTAQPSYNDIQHEYAPGKERHNGVSIRRVALLPERKRWAVIRLLNVTYFLIRAVWDAFRSPTDLLIVSSYPPVAPGFCAWLIHRLKGTPYLYHCLDIQPESAALVGKVRGSRLTRFLKWIDRRTCERAAAVVTLSNEMAQTLRNRGWDGKSIRLINNFHTEPLPKSSRVSFSDGSKSRAALPGETERAFQVVFTGNLGSFQGLVPLVEAAWILRDRIDIQFVLMGAGERKEELQALAGELNGKTVHFIPFQRVEVASQVVEGSDLAVVALLPMLYATAVPSKTMMYLRAGCPILALIESTCALSNQIREHKLGIVPDAVEAQAIADAIRNACDGSPRVDVAERRRLTKVGESLFGYELTLDRWTRLINQLDADSPRKAQPKQSRWAA